MRTLLRLATLVAVLNCLCLSTLADADTYPRVFGVDVLEYVFRVELSDENDVIQGLTTVDLRFNRDGIVEVPLDLIGPPNGEDGTTGMTVSGVWGCGRLRPPSGNGCSAHC